MRRRLQTIEEARPCKAGTPGTGLVKLHGTIRAVHPDQLLISPIEQKPCVYYRLLIEEFRQNTFSSGVHVTSKTTTSGSWVSVIDDVQAIPIVIADETGQVGVDPKEANLDFQVNRKHANLFSSLPKELEESLREKYKIVTKNAFLAKQMRYTETVIEHDQKVFAVGECETINGKPALTKKEHPLLITFRNEKQVLRNGKIGILVMKALAVAFPAGFLTLAVFAGGSLWSQSDSKNNSATKDPTLETIAKLKSNSYSEKARAARKLAQTPVINNQIAQVAPELNALLNSPDAFQREAAVEAIVQGWGSPVNEPGLRRIQQNAPDARIQRDVATALAKIGR
jgi:hypothetical protein